MPASVPFAGSCLSQGQVKTTGGGLYLYFKQMQRRVLTHRSSGITLHRAMDRSCSFASSTLVKGGFASAPCGGGRARCLAGCSPGYQGLQEKQIRAIHTGSFFSASARLITSGGEAVTPAGSNLFPRESCLPSVCVYPHRCGSWKPCLSFWLLAPANSIPGRSPRLVQFQQSSLGSRFWTRSWGRDLVPSAASSFAGAVMALPRGYVLSQPGCSPSWPSPLFPPCCLAARGERCQLAKTRRARGGNKKRHENSSV